MTDSIGETVKKSAQAFWEELPLGVRLSGKAIAYSPVLAKSVAVGLAFPDLDLVAPGIGIGGHRWAVTHSALAAWLGKKGVETINQYVTNDLARTAMREVTATAGAGFCIGLSFHLLKDALWDAEQTVRFKVPFIGGPGTLLEGTYLDDDLWLGANGLFAAKITKDLLVVGFGEDAREALNAFGRWHDQEAVVAAINNARREAMQESRELSEILKQQIPVNGSEGLATPSWIREESAGSIEYPEWTRRKDE